MSETDSEAISSRAEEVFAEYRDLLESQDPPSFDAFCAGHPDLVRDLRRLDQSWRQVSELVERLGMRPPTRGDSAGNESPSPARTPAQAATGKTEARAYSDLLGRLAAQDKIARYRTKEELSRGGMGVVRQVWDRELRRPLAMKTLAARAQAGPTERELERFLEEAQITGQLDHPGVVPVHELGLDHEGRLFFTMRLVRGRTLDRVFELVERGEEGWSVTRALGVILRICETMSFAHDRGVVHRDLKPSNVMVGRFGEVYVMDWGLARVLGKEDHKDIRLAGQPSSHVWTERKEHERHRPDSPLVTMDGDVVGTPAFMSPEQAEGRVSEVGPASDVYSVGGILYQLLSGTIPYGESRTPQSPHVLWRKVLTGPPAPLGSLERDVSPELIAITERAMARPLDERYGSMEELAHDLRAFLEGRVVPVYERGPVAELKKWVRRNRAFAGVSAALVLVAIGAALLYAWNESRRTEEIERYANVAKATERMEAARQLGTVQPSALPEMELWCASVEDLVALRAVYEPQLQQVRVRALAASEEETEEHARRHPAFVAMTRVETFLNLATKTIEALRSGEKPVTGEWMDARECAATMERYLPLHAERLLRLRAAIAEDQPFHFAAAEDRDLHAQLAATCRALRHLDEKALAAVREDIRRARELERTMIENSQRWADATQAISAHSLYGGLRLEPQMGLVPIGTDPVTGLWEFWHVLSGDEPRRDGTGQLQVEEATGIVLVLLPGAITTIGAQTDPRAPNYDPEARPGEAPVEVQLDPFFLSKFELTQSQWLRLTGEVPSFYFLGSRWLGFGAVSGLHPVENVSWAEAVPVLEHVGLDLPTEARWEYGARALAEGPFWFGDRFSSEYGVNCLAPEGDPFPVHGPVHLMPANGFGIHGVLGNVREHCRDRWSDLMTKCEHRPGTGELMGTSFLRRSVRGGSYAASPPDLRLAFRSNVEPDQHDETIGVRPARSIEAPTIPSSKSR